MNKFEQLRAKILESYPSIKTLPWRQRWLAYLSPNISDHTETIETDHGYYKQHATLVEFRGKEYVKCWGIKKLRSVPRE